MTGVFITGFIAEGDGQNPWGYLTPIAFVPPVLTAVYTYKTKSKCLFWLTIALCWILSIQSIRVASFIREFVLYFQ
ncbi:hypothetical protein [uncultured Marinococcus sp.]|uniref:hypothetical protein n=1 Tax=uncultured Marinococcus sp. TaxID=487012 RepID=UPI00263872FD|nr:hypothetical protein [uncultured Marinococcus sp.]